MTNSNFIDIRGARVHNLKNISVKIPKNKFVVLTGISGSGKSSLAFDTIYAEGQRRYVESLSSYARQFLGLMDKPDVDQIDGLSPAIAIDQRSTITNPRSTVGTITEIYDYLRLLFSRIGHVHCPGCGRELFQQTPAQIMKKVLELAAKKETEIIIFSPVKADKNDNPEETVSEIAKAGYFSARIQGEIKPLNKITAADLNSGLKYIEVLVSQTKIPAASRRKKWQQDDLLKAIELAIDLSNGQVIASTVSPKKDYYYFQYYHCPDCGISLSEQEPRNFSFNSPAGACPRCLGLGTRLEVDAELVIPNKKLTLAQGAIKPWTRNFFNQGWYWEILKKAAAENSFSLDVPVAELPENKLKLVLYGTGEKKYLLSDGEERIFEGVINLLFKKFQETASEYLKREISQYMRVFVCPECKGKRLKPESLAVTVLGKNISEISAMTVDESKKFFNKFFEKGAALEAQEKQVANLIIKELRKRIEYLENVGLNYLTQDRSAISLSGGEVQRVRLATQIGLNLSGVVYILDEPSVGLHQKDNKKLIDTLKNLRDLGNTVIVVEHDAMTMEEADHIIDIGPGAGLEGGEIVAEGTPAEIKRNKNSITGGYLAGKKEVPKATKYRKGSGKTIEILGAEEFNLKNIDVKIPLGKFVCLTGVSGSGKSTLMLEILVKALMKKFYRAKELPGKHKEILGAENIDKVISIDQSPIGRTPRSNPATYTGVFTYIRDLFTQTPEAKIRGYDAGKFSFNARGGRCETCAGEGMVKIEMQFLPDVYVACEDCHGSRYRAEVLEVHYQGKNIAEILEMSVTEAMRFFGRQPIIYQKLKILAEVGLGYIKLGQPATTLSGGEAQRIKLATELSRRATGKTLYILDEPTTGLHFEDIKKLLEVLNKLVDKGNTVLIIEHNLDVIKCADWVIDLGPEGGDKGGEVVAVGTPIEVAKVKKSYTGQYLKSVL